MEFYHANGNNKKDTVARLQQKNGWKQISRQVLIRWEKRERSVAGSAGGLAASDGSGPDMLKMSRGRKVSKEFEAAVLGRLVFKTIDLSYKQAKAQQYAKGGRRDSELTPPLLSCPTTFCRPALFSYFSNTAHLPPPPVCL